ncbi:hypothetical protein GKA01_04330 [Gluconobacter kanchanaburiensis NBRC 103587]|uniref:Uncharacterized protein n=1 Tax=Gluconobacter kanchanaburiensis NBRC 103587 TaxID=1307948 RepID=A0A511B468_9PROT|nr:hypothetical protein AA103587_0085 [Gluconobacter kanchanaburiensis NBRC 103587]GEK95236.1 hypothetical protein GKA01_04330 [Gluconobacter kanchanaburiensis NBRC 103587]
MRIGMNGKKRRLSEVLSLILRRRSRNGTCSDNGADEKQQAEIPYGSKTF